MLQEIYKILLLDVFFLFIDQGPSFYIDYEFGEDMYNLSDFAGNKPYVFCTDIDDTVRWTTHYYENKMSILQMKVESSYNKGIF